MARISSLFDTVFDLGKIKCLLDSPLQGMKKVFKVPCSSCTGMSHPQELQCEYLRAELCPTDTLGGC